MVRGEVFRLRFARAARGGEQRGIRYAVVVSPTSTSAPRRSFRPTIELAGTPTRVLVEQTTAVSPERLGKSVGRLSARELSAVDAALAVVFGV